MLRHPVTTAFGASTIVLLILLEPLASPLHTQFYHLAGPVSAVLVPMLLNFAGVWLLLSFLLIRGCKHPEFDSWLWSFLGVALPWMAIKDWYVFHGYPVPLVINAVFAGLVCLTFLTAIVWRSRIQPLLRRARRLAIPMLGFVALSGAVMMGEALWFSWQARHLNAPRPLHPQQAASVPSHGRGRIIWIVFDELSYRQVYEHRFQGLELPAFTDLARTATVFTHTVPSGLYTEQVFPSLFTGRRYDGVRTSAAGWPLEVHDQSLRTWTTLDPRETVFQDALDAGYSTAVAGWFNPYCRILPEVLDRCFWTSHIGLPGGVYPAQSIGWNSYRPVVRHLANLARLAHVLPPQDDLAAEVRMHQQDYHELVDAGDELLREPSAGFVLLHMPIPHLGGIYNRRTSSFVVSRPSYIDNLALCDVYLAHVRHELEENGSWDNATLVIMGDHSWRVHMGWAKRPEWTEEERIASDNVRFDDRPAYIVKLPGQTTPARIDEAFDSIRTRSLFDKLLSGEIRTAEQLTAWAARTP